MLSYNVRLTGLPKTEDPPQSKQYQTEFSYTKVMFEG